MKKYFRLIAVFLVTLGFIGLNISRVAGQSNALAISPRLDLSLEPGNSYDGELQVSNRNKTESLTLNLSVVDFKAQDETGAPQLIKDSKEKTAWSLKDYIELPQQVTIAPNETVRVPIRVSMPSDIGAGSYYSAIEYAANNPEDKERVNISAAGVTLVFVTVPGQVNQQMSLLQFGAFVPAKSGTTGSFKGLYFSDRPKVLAYRLKNDGNVAEEPKATIQVKNMGGKVVYEIKDANYQHQLALRGQTRRFNVCINPENVTNTDAGLEVNSVVCGDTEKLTPGRYTAELAVTYGSNGNETRQLTDTATFWYLPWWLLGVISVIIALIVGGGFYVWRRIESYRGRKTRRR